MIKNLFKKKSRKDEIIEFKSSIPSLPNIPIKKDILNGEYIIFLLTFAAELKRRIQEKGGKLDAVSQSYLDEKGILDVPCEISIGTKQLFVFLYPQVNNTFAEKYKGIQNFVKKNFKKEFCYYAPDKLNSNVISKSPFRKFLASDLRKVDEIPDGTYAMWWPTEEEKKYSYSKAQNFISQAYTSLNGIETPIFGFFLNSLGFSETINRVSLPEEGFVVAVEGPENEIFLFCVSQEKGISFRFNPKTTSTKYRDNFLKAFSEFVKKGRKELEKDELVLDKHYNHGSISWYKSMEKTTVEEEKKGVQFKGIGITHIDKKNEE
ncbi:hypothetical protein H6501_04535 [Candidatus Woesearchaeota archaeon]|nr:hypothetical protein [Nanoarchaeota archaeon]MCB9370839.1 hypothetical protein [Candidatus Woesearchaeota archaeon]USN43939.1 MAG: hypothetical protein H6500_06135 [Candidatus Woesearchaeota archaeon]